MMAGLHAYTEQALGQAAAELPVTIFRWVDGDGREILDSIVTAPRAGLRVSLRDRAGIEIAQTATDRSGSYRFDDVASGDYTVIFTVPSGATGRSGEAAAVNRRDSFWPGDNVVPTPVQTWTSGLNGFQLFGTLG